MGDQLQAPRNAEAETEGQDGIPVRLLPVYIRGRDNAVARDQAITLLVLDDGETDGVRDDERYTE